MKILIHSCCAACLIGPWEQLTQQGYDVTALFYNPNIHPFIEFRRRLKAVKVLQERVPVPVIYVEDYGLADFMDTVVDYHAPDRCAHCYRMRLGRTAQEARERGFDAMTTTLLGSTHQDHELIRRIGRECAEQAGVEFYAEDWRELAEHGHERAREMRLYLQQYCGCVFSEHERFRDTTTHIYKGPGPKVQAEE
jgi:hypothetical protein